MNALRIPSIPVSSIDRENCYFNPGCALLIHKPEAGDKMLNLLREHFGPVGMHTVCCRHDPGLAPGAVIINNCAGCDRRFRSLHEGIRTISLWEVLDSVENLPLPDYEGLTLSVHDSCSFRPKPQVHGAVRSLLKKMNIRIIESEFSGTKSICCGDNLYPQVPAARAMEFMKMRAVQMPADHVAVYCVSCVKSMAIGGKIPHHMLDLVLGEATDPGDTRIDVYHEALDQYISKH